MRAVEHAVEIGVDGLTASGKFDESGLLAAIALVSLEAGDAVPDSLRTVGGTALEDFSVEGRELAVIEADGDLRGHRRSLSVCQPLGMHARGPVVPRRCLRAPGGTSGHQ